MAAWARGRSRRGPQPRNARRARPRALRPVAAAALPAEAPPGADGGGRLGPPTAAGPSVAAAAPRAAACAPAGAAEKAACGPWPLRPAPRSGLRRGGGAGSESGPARASGSFHSFRGTSGPRPPCASSPPSVLDPARPERRAGPGRPAPDLVWPGARRRPLRPQRSRQRTARRLGSHRPRRCCGRAGAAPRSSGLVPRPGRGPRSEQWLCSGLLSTR